MPRTGLFGGFYFDEEVFADMMQEENFWKLLIDKDIKKKDLSSMAGVSPATITKMGKNGHVTTEVLVKICAALDCNVEDIMELIPAKEEM